MRTYPCLLTLLLACSPGDHEPDQPGFPLGAELSVAIHATSPEQAARTALGAPDDLQLTSVRHSLTGAHVRFAQLTTDGTPLLDVETALHFTGSAPDYTLRLINSNAMRPLEVSGRNLGRDDANARALAAVRRHYPDATPRLLASAEYVRPSAAHRGRRGWRIVVATDEPVHEWELWVDGDSGATEIRRDLIWFVDGSGYVYRPNPMTQTGLLTFVDADDADSAELTAARRLVTIPGLDGSGHMVGDYVDAHHSSGYMVDEASLVFDFTRSQGEFEEVNAYYNIDHAQRNLQALGFTGAKIIADFPIEVFINATTQDNSWYSPSNKTITFGSGGVDDAEDGDIVIHEYGHALMDDAVPGYGSSSQAGAIGEAFADMLAVFTPTGDDDLLDRACVGPWDALSYSDDTPPCLRRTDGDKHYPEHWENETHADGEIWTGAMWELPAATGLSRNQVLQLLVEALFLFDPDVSFAESAAAIISADNSLHGGAHVAALNRVLIWHGIDATLSAEAGFPAPTATFAIDIQSPSSIPNNADGHDSITHPGATAIRVHFASFAMASGDNVYIYDGAGRLYAKLSGNLGSFDSVAVPGDTITIRWVTNRNNQSNGISVDSYEISSAELPDAGPIPDAAPIPDATPIPDADPTMADAAPIPDAAPMPDAAPLPDAGGASDAAPGVDGSGQGDDDYGCGCSTGREGLPGGTLILFALVIVTRRRRLL